MATKRTTNKYNNTNRRNRHNKVETGVRTASNTGKKEQPGIKEFRERQAVTSETREAYARKQIKKMQGGN